MAKTIYDIKYATMLSSPKFFDRDTMKFFGQTMRDFRIVTSHSGRIFIYAPTFRYDYSNRKYYHVGWSIREFVDLGRNSGELHNIDIPEIVKSGGKEAIKNYLKNIY